MLVLINETLDDIFNIKCLVDFEISDNYNSYALLKMEVLHNTALSIANVGRHLHLRVIELHNIIMV